MTETHAIQLIVLVYLLIMVGVGLLAGRFVKTSDDFIVGGRRIPWWAAGISIYMSAFSVFTFVADAGNAYTHGMVGALINMGPVLGWMAAALITATLWHRSQITTPVEYLEVRFGPSIRQMFAYISVLFTLNSVATRLFAFGILGSTLLDLPVWQIILMSGVIIASYSLLGGLWAVVLTDVIQFIVLVIGIVPLVFFSIAAIGGLDGFTALSDAGVFAWSKTDKNWGWLVSWWVIEIINALFRFEGVQRFCSVPTEKGARRAGLMASALLVPTLIAALIPVFIAAFLIPDISGEQAFARMIDLVLPFGLVGLIVGAMFAATVSALDSELNVIAGVMTKDVYQRFIKPDADDQRLLNVSRFVTLAFAAVAVSLALVIATSDLGVFEWAEFIVSRFLVIPLLCFLLGLFVRGVGVTGFLFAMGCGVLMSATLWGAGYSPADVRFPNIATCILAMLMASVLFPAKGSAKERIDAFFAKLATPDTGKANASIEALDGATAQLIGLSTCVVGLIPLVIGVFAQPDGSTSLVELGIGGAVMLVGGALYFIGRRSARSAD